MPGICARDFPPGGAVSYNKVRILKARFFLSEHWQKCLGSPWGQPKNSTQKVKTDTYLDS